MAKFTWLWIETLFEIVCIAAFIAAGIVLAVLLFG